MTRRTSRMSILVCVMRPEPGTHNKNKGRACPRCSPRTMEIESVRSCHSAGGPLGPGMTDYRQPIPAKPETRATTFMTSRSHPRPDRASDRRRRHDHRSNRKPVHRPYGRGPIGAARSAWSARLRGTPQTCAALRQVVWPKDWSGLHRPDPLRHAHRSGADPFVAATGAFNGVCSGSCRG